MDRGGAAARVQGRIRLRPAVESEGERGHPVESRTFTRLRLLMINLVGRLAIERGVGSMLTEPDFKERNLPAERLAAEGYEHSARALILQAQNKSLDHSNAAVLANSAERSAGHRQRPGDRMVDARQGQKRHQPARVSRFAIQPNRLQWRAWTPINEATRSGARSPAWIRSAATPVTVPRIRCSTRLYRAPAHLAHQYRAKREHERRVHGAHDLDGPAQQGVRYRPECVSQLWRATSCDWRSHRAQDNRTHPRSCESTRAP